MIPAKIKIGIASNDTLSRKSITTFLISRCSIEVAFEADNGLQLLERLSDTQPDILLIELQMPIMNGILTSRIVLEKFPLIKIIAFAKSGPEEDIISAYQLGIKSFVFEKFREEFPKAIRTVCDGGVYFPDTVADLIRKYFSFTDNEKNSVMLNKTELQLLKSICLGLSSTQIALSIHKSPRTVEDYRKTLYKKFNVENKEQLITRAVKYGLVSA